MEDYPSESTWIGKLFVPLNPFIQSVNNITDNNIDFQTNIKSVTREYSITSFQPFSFTWPFRENQPVDLRVVKANRGSSQSPTILVAAWSYSSTNTTISVSEILELRENAVSALSGAYQFTIRVTV